ncbi:hypothetical protein CSA37_08680 [Candidatus Fermentibacteria bacterium]|nr:MAG: hypothetical protein CSA37_08680 [Candidatus Fermentibacteria bacterium]
MKYTIVAVMALAASAAWALEFETPHVGADLILEYLHFSGDSVYNAQGIYMGDENRFRIRKVAVLLEGRAGENISYMAEAAIAACGGGSNLSIMEAGIFIDPAEIPFRIGLGQLHASRGYSLSEECGQMLLLEKPVWRKTVVPSCHSMGALSEFEAGLGSAGSISSQIGYYNGSSGTSEEDWDFVGWLQYHTPVEGLSAGGFYEKLHLDMNFENEGLEEGERMGFGLDMDNGTVAARVEYLAMTGVPVASVPAGCTATGEEVENTGLLFQAGYTFDPGVYWATGIRPYAGYQVWDRWSNADDGDWKFSWMEAGVQVNIEPESWVNLGWRGPAGTPEDHPEDSSVLVFRMGTEI